MKTSKFAENQWKLPEKLNPLHALSLEFGLFSHRSENEENKTTLYQCMQIRFIIKLVRADCIASHHSEVNERKVLLLSVCICVWELSHSLKNSNVVYGNAGYSTISAWRRGNLMYEALCISIFICVCTLSAHSFHFFISEIKSKDACTHTYLRTPASQAYAHTCTLHTETNQTNTFALTWNIKYIHEELSWKSKANLSPMAYCRDKLSGFQTLTQNCF